MLSLFSVMLVLHWSGDFLCGLKIFRTIVKIVTISWCFCQDYESSSMCYVQNDALPAEMNDHLSNMLPVILETISLAQ